MSDTVAPHLRFIVAGRLQRGYFALGEGRILEDVFTGSAIAAACGIRLWKSSVGMTARVSQSYPGEWLRAAHDQDIDIRGVVRIGDEFEQRVFRDVQNQGHKPVINPVAAYSAAGLPFPSSLLDFHPLPEDRLDSRSRPSLLTMRQSDFPSDYLDATAAHICALDYLSHLVLPPLLRGGHVNTISLEAGQGYMDPSFYEDIAVILHNLSGFICEEEQLLRLFMGRQTDVWEAAADLAEYGCSNIVIRRGSSGYYLFEREGARRWIIPVYPNQVEFPFHAKDAFGGGFIAGLRSSYDPVEAVLQGAISASFANESADVLYPVSSMPGLAAARLEMLRSKVRRA